jgi:hypothetical protein
MTSRIVIIENAGAALTAFEGPSARHAADWAAGKLDELRRAGVTSIAIEWHPAEGGDDAHHDVIHCLHCVRAEMRARPDGTREIIGMLRYPTAVAGARGVAAARKAGMLAAPAAVRGALRVLAAPPDIANPRYPIRVPRGRANVPPGQPRTIAEIRAARRAARARSRP